MIWRAFNAHLSDAAQRMPEINGLYTKSFDVLCFHFLHATSTLHILHICVTNIARRSSTCLLRGIRCVHMNSSYFFRKIIWCNWHITYPDHDLHWRNKLTENDICYCGICERSNDDATCIFALVFAWNLYLYIMKLWGIRRWISIFIKMRTNLKYVINAI